MQDFGFGDLRIVNDFAAPFEAAQLEAKSAVGAGHVMRSAKRFDSLAAAIADCSLVAATTAIGARELHHAVMPLRGAAPRIVQELMSSEGNGASGSSDSAGALGENTSTAPSSAPQVGLLFGSEKTGLTNEQLSHCSLLLTIPMFAPGGRHLSMNLGQAVAVCLYELSRDGFEDARDLPLIHAAAATAADRERLTSLVLQTMRETDYARRFPANARPEVVRHLTNSLGNSREEAATWMGFLKVVLRAIHPAESTDPEARR